MSKSEVWDHHALGVTVGIRSGLWMHGPGSTRHEQEPPDSDTLGAVWHQRSPGVKSETR